MFVSQCSHNRTKEILSIPSFHCPSLVNWVHHSWSFNELSCWSCCSLTWHSIQGVIPTLMPSVPGIISRYIRMKQLMKIIEGVEGMKKGRKLNQTPEGTFIYLFFLSLLIIHQSPLQFFTAWKIITQKHFFSSKWQITGILDWTDRIHSTEQHTSVHCVGIWVFDYSLIFVFTVPNCAHWT